MPRMGLGTTLTQLGRAAKDITSTLETGLQNVAENLEGAFVTLGEGTADRAGCVTRTSSFSSDVQPQSPQTPASPASVPGEVNEGSERERLIEAGTQSGSGGMGCGSSYDQRSSERDQSSPPAVTCDMCGTKFSFISRKRTCGECGNVFCSLCLPSARSVSSSRHRTCERCGVLNKKPPHRGELMKLRVKDLQHFLTRKKINIKSCVEKKDLVELVLQHSQVSSPLDATDSQSSRLSSSESYTDNGIRVSDQVPLERHRNFPQNYTESSHRREWFQEKFGDQGEDGTEAEPASETPLERMETVGEVVTEEITPVEVLSDQHDSEDEVMSLEVENDNNEDSMTTGEKDDKIHAPEDTSKQRDNSETIIETHEEVQGAVGGQVENSTDPNPTSDHTPIGAKRSFEYLSETTSATSLPSSPRRFANHGLVYLNEIETLEDLNELSTKQIKDLLAMNRVNFKGCVEKDELLKILQRLWKQEQRNKENVDNMDDDSLCKICMDSPIDCVMLECGHMCTCTNCGKQMAECPICRQYVVRVVKIFKA